MFNPHSDAELMVAMSNPKSKDVSEDLEVGSHLPQGPEIGYIRYVSHMREALLNNLRVNDPQWYGNLWTATIPGLWEHYLANLPVTMDVSRDRIFIDNLGPLVTLVDGEVIPLLWSDLGKEPDVNATGWGQLRYQMYRYVRDYIQDNGGLRPWHSPVSVPVRSPDQGSGSVQMSLYVDSTVLSNMDHWNTNLLEIDSSLIAGQIHSAVEYCRGINLESLVEQLHEVSKYFQVRESLTVIGVIREYIRVLGDPNTNHELYIAEAIGTRNGNEFFLMDGRTMRLIKEMGKYKNLVDLLTSDQWDDPIRLETTPYMRDIINQGYSFPQMYHTEEKIKEWDGLSTFNRRLANADELPALWRPTENPVSEGLQVHDTPIVPDNSVNVMRVEFLRDILPKAKELYVWVQPKIRPVGYTMPVRNNTDKWIWKYSEEHRPVPMSNYVYKQHIHCGDVMLTSRWVRALAVVDDPQDIPLALDRGLTMSGTMCRDVPEFYATHVEETRYNLPTVLLEGARYSTPTEPLSGKINTKYIVPELRGLRSTMEIMFQSMVLASADRSGGIGIKVNQYERFLVIDDQDNVVQYHIY